jgi:hypothetical protein
MDEFQERELPEKRRKEKVENDEKCDSSIDERSTGSIEQLGSRYRSDCLGIARVQSVMVSDGAVGNRGIITNIKLGIINNLIDLAIDGMSKPFLVARWAQRRIARFLTFSKV